MGKPLKNPLLSILVVYVICFFFRFNEISTTDLALRALGVEPEVGARVPVEFELRGQTHQFDMVVSGWWEAPNSTVSLMIVSRAFLVNSVAIVVQSMDEEKFIGRTTKTDFTVYNSACDNRPPGFCATRTPWTMGWSAFSRSRPRSQGSGICTETPWTTMA